ncbi:hypothetical protein [Thermus neutrinimicus]|uniref:hypothetical protein n=1 Tax=Thermus neutrinimicus TaxID=2908149 RepID=UPI001FAACBBB|nr:hypothetical protein [Thermus neutrinimicus]
MRSLWLLSLLCSAVAQGLEVGAFGLADQGPAFYLRLWGQAMGEGVRLSYALAPYWRLGLGEGGFSLEQLYLVVEGVAPRKEQVGEVDLAFGRMPLTLGEGRLFPSAWDTPGPAGGQEGVWGVSLTLYGEVRWRLGYALAQGFWIEGALSDLKVYAFPLGLGVSGNLALGGGLAYGEAFLTRWGLRGLVGFTWALGEYQLLAEIMYPWAWGVRWVGGSEGAYYWLQLNYREGLGWGVGLELEGFGLSMAGGEGIWRYWVAWRGEF